MGSQTPSRFGEQNQNDAFQNEHLSFCFILKVFFKKKKNSTKSTVFVETPEFPWKPVLFFMAGTL